MPRKLPGSAIVPGSITLDQITGSINDTTNAAYSQANTARNTANDAYGQANSARSDANTTFATINTTFGTVNTSLGTINTNYQAAYAQANTARSDANTTFATVNTTFGTINTSLSTINSSFGTTNTNYQAAYAQANTARGTANDAYAAANTKLSTSGGSISGDLAITGNLTVQGNATTINVTNLSVNDSMILLSTGGVGDSNDVGFIGHIQRGATDTHVGLIRKATENRFYLFDNYEVEPTNNVIDVAGNNFRVGNLRLGIINANSYVTSAGMDVTGQANAAYGQANAARSDANTTFATVNTTFATINTTTATMNTATTNRVLKAGDTMTGNLIISGATVNTATANITTIITGNALTLSTGTGSNGNIIFSANGAEDMRIIANGFVGIGTTNPATRLDVRANTNDIFQIESASHSVLTGLSVAAAFSRGNDGSGRLGAIFGWNNGGLAIAARGGIVFATGGDSTYSATSRRMDITDGGNVGIGITNPSEKLVVAESGTSLNCTFWMLGTNGAGGQSNGIKLKALGAATSSGAGTLTVETRSTDLSYYERFRIASDGNVGIGTTNPTINGGGLHVNRESQAGVRVSATGGANPTAIEIGADTTGNGFIQTVTANANLQLFTNLANVVAMTLASSGRVGIGTTIPDYKLHINSTQNALKIQTSSASFASPSIDLLDGSVDVVLTAAGGSSLGAIGTYSNHAFTFNTNNSERMRIDTSGRVLINTTASPTVGSFTDTSLYIKQIADGTAGGGIHIEQNASDRVAYFGFSSTAFRIGTSYRTTGTYYPIQLTTSVIAMHIGTDGYVGIGTTNPSARLHIDNGTSNALYIKTTVADTTTRDAIYLYENDGQASGRQAISWYNGNQNFYKAKLWTQVGSDYNNAMFGIDVADDSRTLATRLVIKNGNVGIGTTVPGAILHSYISSGYAGRFETGTDAQIALISPNTWAGIFFNDTNGNDHIWFWGGTGTFTIGGGGSNQISGKKLHVDGGTSIGNSMDNTAMPTNGLLVEGVVRAGPNWTQGDMQLSGDLSGYAVNTYPTLKTSGGSIHFDALGTYTGYISYNSGFADISDARLKEDVRDIVNPFDVIANLRGVKFKWSDNRDEGQDHSGFIAQEVQEHLPEAVTTSDPGIMGIHTPPIVAYLVEAVKELKIENDALKSRVAALEAQ